MSHPSHSHSGSSGGFIHTILLFFTVAVLGGLAVAMLYVSVPQNLSDIGGYRKTANEPAARDLKAVLRASLDRGHTLILSETEINRWLNQTLKAKQKGLLAPYVSMEGVCVRLEKNVAEIVMVRKAFGKPFTVSMFLKIDQFDGPKGLRTVVHRHGGRYSPLFPKPMRGGRFGQLLVPQGFLALVIPSYMKLAEVYSEELRLGFREMEGIRIEKNRLVLEPKVTPKPVKGR